MRLLVLSLLCIGTALTVIKTIEVVANSMRHVNPPQVPGQGWKNADGTAYNGVNEYEAP